MSQEQHNQPPKVLKFLNDYRKELSVLKIKSFYANHLCKKSCLEGKLDKDPSICFQQCDNWLDAFFLMKKDKNPDKEQLILLSSENIGDSQRKQYQKNAAVAKIEIKNYLKSLDDFIDIKIAQFK